MSDLTGKRVLLFSPKFFGYENDICREIELQGGIVKLYDERNNPSSIEKIIIRKAHFLLESRIFSYYKGICETEKSFNPDYVLFISPEAVNKKSIILMKEKFSSAKFILYMYDSIENKNAKKIYQFFDKCLSFDSDDCKKYGFIFRPLFFIKAFEKKKGDITENKYDFAFIGSIHSDRAKILNQLKKYFEKNNLRFFYYLYVPGKFMLMVRSLLDKNFRELRKDYVHIEPLDKSKVSSVLSNSNYVIDINHPRQIGLTMRTIEMLGLHKKLLTTNSHIQDYDFYNQSNQIVIFRNKISIDKTKLINGYNCESDDIYDKYRLSTWIKEIFE